MLGAAQAVEAGRRAGHGDGDLPRMAQAARLQSEFFDIAAFGQPVGEVAQQGDQRGAVGMDEFAISGGFDGDGAS